MMCGCGQPNRYSHFKDGVETSSCNKYAVCLTYDEQFEQLKAANMELLLYKTALEKIVRVNGMDYEYKAWAKAVLPEEG
jgi:hypothetical protein